MDGALEDDAWLAEAAAMVAGCGVGGAFIGYFAFACAVESPAAAGAAVVLAASGAPGVGRAGGGGRSSVPGPFAAVADLVAVGPLTGGVGGPTFGGALKGRRALEPDLEVAATAKP